MRLAVILVVILSIGITAMLVAFLLTPKYAETKSILKEPNTVINNAEKINQEKIQEGSLPSKLSPSEEVISSNNTATNVTSQACVELEKRWLEEFDKAQQELNRKQNEYDRAVERYDDLLDIDERNEITINQSRSEKEAAKKSLEDAQHEYDRILKRLSKARIECGLYS